MNRGDSTTVRYRALFRDREFSALFFADACSRIGSQLGKFALAALVFERTRSAGLAAVTFATTYLPGVLGGPVLSTLADRLPRRGLLVGCDLIRAGLVGAIAFVPMPIIVALGILLLVELVKVPFGAARMAILADILDGDRFTAGNALVGATQQAVQVLGFGVGGFALIVVGSQGALIIDSSTFLLSALVIATLVAGRPAPTNGDEDEPKRARLLHDTAEGIRVVARTPRLPTLMCLLVIGPTVLGTAEGLALPYAHSIGGSSREAGLLLAAAPLGAVIGLSWIGRMAARRRERLLIPMSMIVGGCIASAAIFPIPPVVIGLLLLAGVAMGHVAHLQASIVQLVAAHVRGRVIGLANTLLQLGQAAAILLAGLVAELTSIRAVLFYAGLAAAAGVMAVSMFGAPYPGRHRADIRQIRRERRRQRLAARATAAGGRRVAEPDPTPPVHGRYPAHPVTATPAMAPPEPTRFAAVPSSAVSTPLGPSAPAGSAPHPIPWPPAQRPPAMRMPPPPAFAPPTPPPPPPPAPPPLPFPPERANGHPTSRGLPVTHPLPPEVRPITADGVAARTSSPAPSHLP